MSLSDKKAIGYDLVGVHPVDYKYHKNGDVIPVKDIKKVVKKLKKRYLDLWFNANGKTFTLNEIRDEIDKKFGKDLI